MAALNYYIKLNDDLGDHSQYTGTLYQDGTYTPGTSKLVSGGAGTGLGLGEIINQLMERARDLVAETYNVDPVN